MAKVNWANMSCPAGCHLENVDDHVSSGDDDPESLLGDVGILGVPGSSTDCLEMSPLTLSANDVSVEYSMTHPTMHRRRRTLMESVCGCAAEGLSCYPLSEVEAQVEAQVARRCTTPPILYR